MEPRGDVGLRGVVMKVGVVPKWEGPGLKGVGGRRLVLEL